MKSVLPTFPTFSKLICGLTIYDPIRAFNSCSIVWDCRSNELEFRVHVGEPAVRSSGLRAAHFLSSLPKGQAPLEQLAAQAPAGRPGTADEIAEAIVSLATDRSSFVYGANLAVDGGRTDLKIGHLEFLEERSTKNA
jgi:hypothetical protein